MPLPLGHAAIGLATYEANTPNVSALNRWKLFIFIAVLANLPDIDIVVGLLFKSNGNAFHRGPTHSLLFALTFGYAATLSGKRMPAIPDLGFRTCFLLIFSHIIADWLLTSSPVSLLWPLEVYWSPGYSDWNDILHHVLFKGFQDTGIVISCVLFILAIRSIKWYFLRNRQIVRVRHKYRK